MTRDACLAKVIFVSASSRGFFSILGLQSLLILTNLLLTQKLLMNAISVKLPVLHKKYRLQEL